VLSGWYLSFVQRCVGEVFAGEGDVKKGERCGLGCGLGVLGVLGVRPGWC